MISKKLQDAINCQIVAEMWSSNLYFCLCLSIYRKKVSMALLHGC